MVVKKMWLWKQESCFMFVSTEFADITALHQASRSDVSFWKAQMTKSRLHGSTKHAALLLLTQWSSPLQVFLLRWCKNWLALALQPSLCLSEGWSCSRACSLSYSGWLNLSSGCGQLFCSHALPLYIQRKLSAFIQFTLIKLQWLLWGFVCWQFEHRWYQSHKRGLIVPREAACKHYDCVTYAIWAKKCFSFHPHVLPSHIKIAFVQTCRLQLVFEEE